jgi:hypothetical protein
MTRFFLASRAPCQLTFSFSAFLFWHRQTPARFDDEIILNDSVAHARIFFPQLSAPNRSAAEKQKRDCFRSGA